GIVQRFTASGTCEHCDRHAPYPLPRDTPIRPRLDHVGDALFAPRRVPFDLLNLSESSSSEGHLSSGCPVQALLGRGFCFHRYEPLLRGAKDHWIVTAPAVRVLVLNILRVQQSSASLQQFDDRFVRLKDLQAVVLRQSIVNYPVGI